MKMHRIVLALVTPLLLAGFGCQRQAAPTDQQISSGVQAKLSAESALSGQNIQVTVHQGTVTLSGEATDPASRALAGNDAGSVAGVRTVVNNLDVLPQVSPTTTTAAAPAPQPLPPPPPAPERRSRTRVRPRYEKPAPQPEPAPAPVPLPAPALAQTAPPPPPPPPPQPIQKTITLASGTVLPVRIAEPLDSASSQTGDTFHATLAADIVRQGMVVIPQGTPLLGRVADARNAAHFSGSSLLSLELTSVSLRGRQVALYTNPFEKQGQARGKNTGVKVGGGAVLGSIIGALAGGGKGAAIGAIAGAGAGTAANAATRGQQVQIPSESLLNFVLQSPLTITTSRLAGSAPPPPVEPTLEHRPQ